MATRCHVCGMYDDPRFHYDRCPKGQPSRPQEQAAELLAARFDSVRVEQPERDGSRVLVAMTGDIERRRWTVAPDGRLVKVDTEDNLSRMYVRLWEAQS